MEMDWPMKKPFLVLFSLLIVLAIFLWFVPAFTFFPRRLSEGQQNKLVRARNLENARFYLNLRQVLEYYDIPFGVAKNGTVKVPLRIILDKELSWNYTQKAQDVHWLESRQSMRE